MKAIEQRAEERRGEQRSHGLTGDMDLLWPLRSSLSIWCGHAATREREKRQMATHTTGAYKLRPTSYLFSCYLPNPTWTEVGLHGEKLDARLKDEAWSGAGRLIKLSRTYNRRRRKNLRREGFI